MTTILHPTDFSPLSEKVLQAALARATALGARLIILHVHVPQETIEGEFGMPPPEPEPSDEEILAAMQALLPENVTVPVEFMIARGMAAEEIVRAAEKTKCDMIMLANHERQGFLERWFHGNIIEQVKKNAPCWAVAMTAADVTEPVVASSEGGISAQS